MNVNRDTEKAACFEAGSFFNSPFCFRHHPDGVLLPESDMPHRMSVCYVECYLAAVNEDKTEPLATLRKVGLF